MSENSDAANTYVTMDTNYGKIQLELYPDKAPKTVENFVAYVEEGFYDGTIFHRVIPGFMIQGGGLTEDMNDKPNKRAPIQNEANNKLSNKRGTISMARTNYPHSATSQFFINHEDNEMLDYQSPDNWGYAVFGRVIDGMDVVDKIAKVQTGNSKGHQNVPVKPVIIEKVTIQFKK